MLVTIIPNFALFSYFTTDPFHYQPALSASGSKQSKGSAFRAKFKN